MTEISLQEREKERLKSLYKYNIMDSDPEAEFDDIVRIASYICKTPISLITLLDENRQWFKAKVGLEIDQTAREVAFCDHAIQEDDLMIVEDAQEDDRFRENPLVKGDPNIRFYAGMPISNSLGHNLGTLCVIDRVPRVLDEEQQFALRTLARSVMEKIELRRYIQELRLSIEVLKEQNQQIQEINDFNTKLQSIISHDLRNPIGATRHFLNFIKDGSLKYDEILHWSKAIDQNMALSEQLLENLIELGSGSLKPKYEAKENVNIHDLVNKIMQDLGFQLDMKQNKIKNHCADLEVKTQPDLLEFVLRNLIQNSNKFSQNGLIELFTIQTNHTSLKLEVRDNGIGIDSERLSNIFEIGKSKVSEGTSGEKGNGLGLSISKSFIESLNGKIWVQSELGKGTSFFIEIPLPSKES